MHCPFPKHGLPHSMVLVPTALRRRLTAYLAGLLAMAALAFGGEQTARAQIPLAHVAQHHPKFASRLTAPRLNAGRPARMIVPRTGMRASVPRVGLSPNFSIVAAENASYVPAAFWSPPKRLLLDQVRPSIGLPEFRQPLKVVSPDEAGRGRGVVVGIVDGAIDLRHPDLRNTDGSTRAAWLLDFESQPQGYHPELEEEYGCNDPTTPCAVLSAAEINRGLDADTSINLPTDPLGHGTHVASIAVGGGRANPVYEGVAPEATLIVARLAAAGFEVQDADVVLAARFVYERATELEQPAVVNLSLGGDFGPHDGSTVMERALVSLLEQPGRAMIVAAGNSGTLYEDGPSHLAGPFGIHSDITVVGETDVTLVIPRGQSKFEGDILVWVDVKPDQDLSLGVSSETATVVAPVSPGNSADGSNAEWEALVYNRVDLEEESLTDFERGVLVILSGTFRAYEEIHLRFVGNGQASSWVQSTGELTDGYRGALFDLARQGGTITVPAAAPELIAVGATLNRVRWPSRNNELAQLASFSEQLDLTPGSVAFFSSLGPNQLGNLKPDILAPGAIVIGAMSASADPVLNRRRNTTSMFGSSPICEVDALCSVVDDTYAVAMGTSMAAPVVAGAVALLLEREPTLTQTQIMAMLRAGASRQAVSRTTASWEKELPPAPGGLHIQRSAKLLADQQLSSSKKVDAEASWLSFADVYVAPGATLEGTFRARSKDDDPVHLAEGALTLNVTNGKVTNGPSQVAPGLFRFVVRSNADVAVASEDSLRVQVKIDGETLLRGEVPIAGDLGDVRGISRTSPKSLPRNSSCAVGGHTPFLPSHWGWSAGLLGLGWLRRRRQRPSSC
jgi:MYXO-CTERM domain-containing protein